MRGPHFREEGAARRNLTLPGFRHDVCSAVHPLVLASPFFRSVDLDARGVNMLVPPVAFAHPLDGGRAAAVLHTVDETAKTFGPDSTAYRRLFGPLAADMARILPNILRPLRKPPRYPLATARLALPGLLPATAVARLFRTEEPRALLAGASAHAMLPLNNPLTGSYALFFVALGHAYGWPVVEMGSGQVIDALIGELTDLGGKVHLGRWVRNIDEVDGRTPVLLDVSARQLAAILGRKASPSYRRALSSFRYAPGVCKVDWALRGAVPWQAPVCRQAGALHLGGAFEEVAAAESDVAAGIHPERPFCIVAQPGVVDASRAPPGHQALWAYCHVPRGSSVDMTDAIEAQIERFAPGFRDLVIARATKTAAELEAANPNYVGGDISGGAASLRQTIFRPAVRWDNYRTGVRGVYLCSASAPPGGGVHGMCGYWAAQRAYPIWPEETEISLVGRGHPGTVTARLV